MKKVLIAIAISIAGAMLGGNVAFAKTTSTPYGNQVVQKTLLNSLYKCYTDGGVKDEVAKLSGFSSFANQADNSVRVYLPTGLTPITNDSQTIGCKGLIAGDASALGSEPGTFEGLFSLAGKTINPNTKDGKIALLTGMGYEDAGYTDDAAAVDNCVAFEYNETEAMYSHATTKVMTDNVCAVLDSNGKIDHFVIDTSTATYAQHGNTSYFLPFFQEKNGKIRFARATYKTNYGFTTVYKDTTKGVGDTWEDFLANIEATAATEPVDFTYRVDIYQSTLKWTYDLVGNSSNGNTNQNNTGDSRYEFVKLVRTDGFGSRGQKAGIAAANYLSKNSSTTYKHHSDLSFEREERMQYYLNVLMNHYYEGKDPGEYWICNVSDWNHYSLNYDTEFKISIEASGELKQKDCRLNSAQRVTTGNWNAFYKEGDYWYFGVASDFDTLIGNINALATYYEKDDTITDDPDIQNPEPGDDDGNGPAGAAGINQICMSNAEAESLSWIVCPGVDGLANGSDGIYGVIKDMLVVDSNMISDGADNPTYQIWKYFRDFANVIFIILILIVIISQVTGFGIDNYGIKKMLPRLIICAVLVNLSYIICQFAVDFSNIVGSSINLLLSSWANTVSDGGVGVGLASIIEVIIGGGGAAVAGAAPFAITAISVGVTGWWLVLIIVVIMLLVILIAVLVVFLMLGARQLIVVVAVAIAPVAIICYALPNTEKLFKRWLDIFKAALVMFPIVSALSGLGQVVQAIVFGAGGEELAFSMALLAAACPFLPFLVLPSLLKSSLKAVGDLGGKLTGLKNRAFGAAHTANSSLRNTDAYKDAQFQTAMARNTRRLAKFKNADGSWIDDSKLSAGQLRRRNLYQRRDLAFQKTNLERENLDKGGYDAGVASLESAQNKQALDNEMVLMAKDTSNYDTDVMNKQLEDLLTRDTALSGQDELRMKALMQKLATGSGYGKKLLAKTVGNASTATRAQAAKFMSKSGEVAGAINSKNLAAGQYLREVNAGTAGADSFSAWKSATRTIKVDGQDVTMSNAQFVLSKVATDDADFVGQSAGAVAEGLGMKEAADGSYVVNSTMSQANVLSDARLADMINNERLMDAADSDVRRAMVAAANARGLSVPAKYGGAAPEAPTPVINNPTPVAPVDPTQLNIQHPAPQIQTPTQPASASTPAPQSIRDQILNVQPGELERLKAEADRKMNGGRGPNV